MPVRGQLVSTFKELWPKFKRSKRYREAFVAQHAKQEIGFQIRALLKQYDLTQAALAKRAGLTQGVVSRAADPSYGKLSIKTLLRIAAGFDVAFVGRFVPFSELPKWFDRIYSEPFNVASFEREDAAFELTNSQNEAGAAEATGASTAMAADSLPDNVVRMWPARKGPKRSQMKTSDFQPIPQGERTDG
jgi:transcriptional regulator with XRE-family HTH domain